MRRLSTIQATMVVTLLAAGSIVLAPAAQASTPTSPQTAQLAAFLGPTAGAVSNDRVYTAGQIDNQTSGVQEIDPSTGATVAEITFPTSDQQYNPLGTVGGIAVSPDGNTVYATDGNQVTVIDTRTRSVVTNIVSPVHSEQGPANVGLTSAVALSPDGSTLYVAQEGATYRTMQGPASYPGDILVVDTSTDTISDIVTLAGPKNAEMALANNGRNLFIDETGIGVEDYQVGTGTPVDAGTLPLIDRGQYDPAFLFVSPTGDTLYAGFSIAGGCQVNTVIASTAAVTDTVQLPAGYGYPVALGPGGNSLYLTSTKNSTTVLSVVSTSDFALLGSTTAGVADLNFVDYYSSTTSPDGSILYLPAQANAHVGDGVLRIIPTALL